MILIFFFFRYKRFFEENRRTHLIANIIWLGFPLDQQTNQNARECAQLALSGLQPLTISCLSVDLRANLVNHIFFMQSRETAEIGLGKWWKSFPSLRRSFLSIAWQHRILPFDSLSDWYNSLHNFNKMSVKQILRMKIIISWYNTKFSQLPKFTVRHFALAGMQSTKLFNENKDQIQAATCGEPVTVPSRMGLLFAENLLLNIRHLGPFKWHN